MNAYSESSRFGGYSGLSVAKNREHHAVFDLLFKQIARCCAACFPAILLGLSFALVYGAFPSMKQFGAPFLLSSAWNPVSRDFGALSSVYGTTVSSVIALLFAVPLSVLIAVYLVQPRATFLHRALGAAIDLLAAVPSIIFGMWALYVFAPISAEFLQPALGRLTPSLTFFQGSVSGVGLFNAGMILAVMVLPYMTSMIKEAFTVTPALLKEAAYGLGATDWEVLRDVGFRYAWRGIVAACLLGMLRAFGETMAVVFVIGKGSSISGSLFAPANTLTSRLVNELSEATADPLHLSALIELGLLLFVISVVLQAITQLWLQGLRTRAGGIAR